MTVCIAAACRENKENKIIFCADWKISSALGSAETKLKTRNFSKTWLCLTAGNEPDINAVIKMFRQGFNLARAQKLVVDEVEATRIAREVVARRKREQINEFTQATYGLSYDDFLSFGKDKLPSDLHREALLDMRNLRLGVELILGGFDAKGFSHLVKVNADGRVSVHEEFAVVGEGAYLAQTVLLHRGHNDQR